MTDSAHSGGDDPLPLTEPVTDIVVSALEALRDRDGLDRDEAYLLARLRAGETLELRKGIRMNSASPDWVGCPDADVCRSCPCAADDDVCFPGERLRAENERLRRLVEQARDLVAEAYSDEEDNDSPGNMAFAVLNHALEGSDG